LNLDRLRELFSGVDWAGFEGIVNKLYTVEGKGRRPKPPVAYFRLLHRSACVTISAIVLLLEVVPALIPSFVLLVKASR
jgi:hypothetical protein